MDAELQIVRIALPQSQTKVLASRDRGARKALARVEQEAYNIIARRVIGATPVWLPRPPQSRPRQMTKSVIGGHC
jgi:hypothetical protein